MRVQSLHTYPVKGCYRLDHDRAEVEPWGLRGDRRWLIVDADTGRFVSQREHAGLTQLHPSLESPGLVIRAPGRPPLEVAQPVAGERVDVSVWRFEGVAAAAGAVADEWLSAVLDRKVRLVWLDDPRRRAVNPDYGQPGDVVSFADGYPVLLANAASLAALNDWILEAGSVDEPLPMARFRPNLVIEDAPAWVEDSWLGGRIRVGGVVLRVVKPCPRCVVTTTDQETGERGREPLRTLARYRRVDQDLNFAVNLIPDGSGQVAIGDEVEAI